MKYTYSEKNEIKLDIPKKFEKIIDNPLNSLDKQKKRRKTTFNVMLAIRIFACALVIVSLYLLIDKIYEYTRDISYSNAIREEVSVNAVQQAIMQKRPTPKYPKFEGSEESHLDYPVEVEISKIKQLALAYPDFIGWFYIEGTSISYPAVQAADNDKYLRRNMDLEDNLAGTLFFDYRNDLTTFRGNNIIYGHAMQNGTMFGKLRNFAKKDYYNQHKRIYFYTENEVTVWQIFSAYDTTTANYYIQTEFPDDDEYLKFLNRCKSDSNYETGVKLTAESDILTLSTCYLYETKDGRFVVHAVKVGSVPLT